jgi:ADP-heptose:LPS heptosyltransferase
LLVLRPGALGDTLLAVPALRGLRRAGFSNLTLAAHGSTARFLESVGEVDRGLAFEDPSLGWLFRGDSGPLEEQIVAWLKPQGMPGLRDALVVAPSRPSISQHLSTYLLSTLSGLGVDAIVDDRPLEVLPIQSDEILVHPGSGSATKNWPAARFAETIGMLDRPVRMIVGEADAQAAATVEAGVGDALERLEHPPLAELAARLAGCYAYLGNDSGVSHLAGLTGARCVVLFGPTSPVLWRPLGREVSVESFDVDPRRVAALLTTPSTSGRGFIKGEGT